MSGLKAKEIGYRVTRRLFMCTAQAIVPTFYPPRKHPLKARGIM